MYESLYFESKVKIINPHGSIVIVTGWSKKESVIKSLEDAKVDMSKDKSKVALVANLYGEGFRYMLRNLLNNPQINTIILLGRDTTKSFKTVENFFNFGTDHIESDINYVCDGVDVSAVRVVGTNYIMDDMVDQVDFGMRINVYRAGAFDGTGVWKAANFINAYTPPVLSGDLKRLVVPIPDVVVEQYPSNERSHHIEAVTPVEAYKQVVHDLFRFGVPVDLEKGPRRELQGLKVLVTHPTFESDETIRNAGFDPEEFRQYQDDIIDGELPTDKDYTYGHRFRSYFGIDSLESIRYELSGGLDDRVGYMTTWDNTEDIDMNLHRPCMTSAFFRKEKGKIHLTVTFRSQNGLKAWYENFYGAMSLMRYMCEGTDCYSGEITIFSHSISLDPSYMEQAKIIHDEVKKNAFERRDPNGHFTFAAEDDEIIVSHWNGPVIINTYRGKKPQLIQNRLYRDKAISDINHAMYVGRQLELVYQSILTGCEYIEK